MVEALPGDLSQNDTTFYARWLTSESNEGDACTREERRQLLRQRGTIIDERRDKLREIYPEVVRRTLLVIEEIKQYAAGAVEEAGDGVVGVEDSALEVAEKKLRRPDVALATVPLSGLFGGL